MIYITAKHTNSITHVQYRSKKVNVSMVRYTPGTLEFGGAVQCGAVRSAYYRLCAHARSCARLGFVHVALWLTVAMWKTARPWRIMLA